MMKPGPNGHTLLEPKDCKREMHRDDDTGCPVCHWRLGICATCNAAEVELAEPCPGVPRSSDPVHQDADGWWFWDELWVNRVGPFLTNVDARTGLVLYAVHLDGRPEENAARAEKELAALLDRGRRQVNNEGA